MLDKESLLSSIRSAMEKEAYAPPAPMPMDPAMGAAPPMDPAMMGAPPMDPMAGGMPPMDPMAGGMPPMDPMMDPAMGGMPPMDPAAVMDPAMGGMPPVDPAVADPLTPGSEAEAASTEAIEKLIDTVEKLDKKVGSLEEGVVQALDAQGIMPPEQALNDPQEVPEEEVTPEEVGFSDEVQKLASNQALWEKDLASRREPLLNTLRDIRKML